MPDIYHRSIAFTERESSHPDMGAHGILRKEWRLIPFNPSNPAHALTRQGRRDNFSPTVILEQRYIRRGDIESWETFDAYDTDTEALSAIDPKATSIDCPELVWVQHDYRKSMREYEERLTREREEQSAREERRRLRGLSHVAWTKLYNSPRYRPLCDEWNELNTRPGALSIKGDLALDNEFMRLYNLAHLGSTTTISKRQAMRACIDYYNFMWKHREPVLPGPPDNDYIKEAES